MADGGDGAGPGFATSARRRAEALIAAGDHPAALEELEFAAGLERQRGNTTTSVDLLLMAGNIADCPDRRLCLFEQAARAAGDGGDPRTDDLWLQLAEQACSAGVAELQALALYQHAWNGDADAMRAGLERAASLGDAGWAHRSRALLAIMHQQYERAREHDERALVSARAARDRRLEALALLGISVADAMTGNLRGAIDNQRHAVEVSTLIGDHRAVVTGRLNLMQMLHENCESRVALDVCHSLLAYTAEHGLDGWRREVIAFLALWEALCGDVDGALRRLRTLSDDDRTPAGDATSRAYVTVLEALVRLERGDVTALGRCLAAGEGVVLGQPTESLHETWRGVRVRYELMSGNPAAAVRLATEAAWDDPAVAGPTSLALVRHSVLVDGSPDTLDAARTILAGIPIDATPVARLAAEEARALMDAPASALASEEVMAIAERWSSAGRPLDAARAKAWAVWVGRGMRDADEAFQMLVDCHDVLRTGGAAGDARRVEEWLAQLAPGASSIAGDAAAAALLDGLTPREVRRLDQIATSFERPDGHRFVDPANASGTIYVISEGRVRLYRETENGERRLTLALLEAGAVLCESSLIGAVPDGTCADAEGPVRVWAIDAGQLRALSQRIPRLTLNLLQVASERAQQSQALAERIGHWTVPRRLAAVVLELDARHGHPTLAGERIINSRVTQADLAEMICARRETVNEVLRDLRSQGVLATSGRRIVVRDRVRLQAMLAGS